jgi:hypothetical protein
VSHAFANAYQNKEKPEDSVACPWSPDGKTGEPSAACLDTQDPPKTAGTAAAPALIRRIKGVAISDYGC